jgi:hypothetical protein
MHTVHAQYDSYSQEAWQQWLQGAGGGGERTDWNWKTGRCCRMWCFTADASVVRTQYLVVDRTKPWHAKESASGGVKQNSE